MYKHNTKFKQNRKTNMVFKTIKENTFVKLYRRAYLTSVHVPVCFNSHKASDDRIESLYKANSGQSENYKTRTRAIELTKSNTLNNPFKFWYKRSSFYNRLLVLIDTERSVENLN